MPGRDGGQATERRGVSWLQVNVALRRDAGRGLVSARALFAAVMPEVRTWRQQGAITHFFFMRKEPDLRLRFGGHAPRQEVYPKLTAMLEQLVERRWVHRFFTSVYEPEVHLFGGPEAMGLAHDYFDEDTTAWMEFDRLWAMGGSHLTPDAVTTAVMNDLFWRTLHDCSEVWDAWWNLDALIGADPRPMTTMPALFPDSLEGVASPAEHHLLVRYRDANEVLAKGLTKTWNDGRLECGLRAVLPFHAMFHFHRYGLQPNEQAALAAAMRRAWNPRKGLRGDE